jgi:hypothetical protein
MNEAGSAFESPIRFEYRPPLRFILLLAVMHVGAIVAVLLSDIPAWIQTALVALAGASLFGGCGRWLHGARDPAPPVLQLNSRDEWLLLRAGHGELMQLGDECVVLPWLVVLHLRNATGASHFFILGTDNMRSDMLRRLRVRLRFPIVRQE